MKKSIVIICLIFLSILSVNAAFAQNLCDTYPDPENHTWTAEWIDDFGGTTYSLIAPCKVFLTVPFTITVTAVDNNYPDTWVGGFWTIEDTPAGGSTIILDSGSFIVTDEFGEWRLDLPVTYTGEPVNHSVEFSFLDFGSGSGGHNWGGGAIGDIVVDPYPSGFPDDDGDGVPDDQDICPGGDDNVDTDGDFIPDFCDPCPDDAENDADGDGICESVDNCPLIANDNQNDIDEDNIGDACDADIDGDSVLNDDDNCPYDVNTEQTDTDGDGAGDVCDADIDGDGVLDADDACVPTPLGEVVNADGCSISEICPCAHPVYGDKWKNHGAYVRCVAHTSEDFVSAGLITEIEKDAVVSEAGGSSCGHKQ